MTTVLLIFPISSNYCSSFFGSLWQKSTFLLFPECLFSVFRMCENIIFTFAFYTSKVGFEIIAIESNSFTRQFVFLMMVLHDSITISDVSSGSISNIHKFNLYPIFGRELHHDNWQKFKNCWMCLL